MTTEITIKVTGPSETTCSHAHPPSVPTTPCDEKKPGPAPLGVQLDPAPPISAYRHLCHRQEIDTAADAYKLLAPALAHMQQEVFLIIMLDTHGRVLDDGIVEVAKGQREQVGVGIEDVEREVLLRTPNRFFAAHVHPSGRVKPSDADGKLTEAIQKAFNGKTRDIIFLDHLVIAAQGGGAYYSFANGAAYRGPRVKKPKAR